MPKYFDSLDTGSIGKEQYTKELGNVIVKLAPTMTSIIKKIADNAVVIGIAECKAETFSKLGSLVEFSELVSADQAAIDCFRDCLIHIATFHTLPIAKVTAGDTLAQSYAAMEDFKKTEVESETSSSAS